MDDPTAEAGPARAGAWPELCAYALDESADVELVAAPARRTWMDVLPDRYANRCLPLLIANQSGWLLINPQTVWLTWDGSGGVESVTVEYDGVAPRTRALSHFGQGIVTFHIPYLFRTSPGWNLLVRGPANCPIDGLYALDGVVETEWSTATFTMNWQLTRPGLRTVLPEGEPLCMIVPQRRGDLESVRPVRRLLADDPDLAADVAGWMRSREQFLADLPLRGSAAAEAKWQKDYFRGRDAAQRPAPVHQTRLRLGEFEPDNHHAG